MEDRINYYIFIPTVFLLFFLETTFVAQIFHGLFLPNLVLIFIIAGAFLSYSPDVLYAALVFGFLFDIFSGSNFGIFTLSFVLSVMAISFLKAKFLKEETFIKVVAAAAGAALVYDLIYSLMAILVFGTNFASYFGIMWQKTLFDMIYAAILVYPAMRLISKKQG